MTRRDQQAVVLLKLLGEDGLEQVLGHLPPGQAEELRRRVRESSSPLTLGLQREVLAAFEEQLALVKRSLPQAPPNLRVFAPQYPHVSDQEEEQAEDEPFALSDKPLQDLERIPVIRLGVALADEHPRTIAVLLNQLSPPRIAEVLKSLPDGPRDQVVVELTRESRVSRMVLERLARTVLLRAISLPADDLEKRDRIQRMADVLRNLEKSRRLEMLVALEERDPETADKLIGLLYRFEDIQQLDDSMVQRVLSEVDAETLSVSLFEVADEIKQKLMSNLSKRARVAIEEELQFQKKVPRIRVEHARNQIVRVVAKLDREEGA